jgi:hypothetical protein
MRLSAIILILGSLIAAPSLAWEGALASKVRSISEVVKRAESGDRVVVEGRVTNVELGSGSRYIVTLNDGSGSVYIRVPEHLIRHIADGDTPQVGTNVRVGGKWTHAYLDNDTWGIHAQTAERVATSPASAADEAPIDCPGSGCDGSYRNHRRHPRPR